LPNAIHPDADTHLARPRLLEALRRAQDKRCVVLAAPAGSGKTALLAAWARQLRTQRTVVWVDAAGGRGLAAELAARCAAQFPGWPAPPRRRERNADAFAESMDLAVRAVRHAAASPKPVVLLIDHLDRVEDASVLLALQPLLDYAPPTLQCVFASREALALPLERLRMHGQLLELGAAEMRWSDDEAHALVQSRLGEAAEAPALQQASRGWTLGLVASCEALQRGARSGKATEPVPAMAAHCLETEVFSHWSAPRRRTVEVLAAMPVFDAGLVAAAGAMSMPEAHDFVHRLVRTGFVDAAPTEGWWTFHPMMAAVLQRRFARLKAAKRRHWHGLASLYFTAHGRHADAVRQAVAGRDLARAADLVETWAGALFQSGRHDALAELVRLVPASAVRHRLQLRLWVALLALTEQRFDDCEAMLAALEGDVEASDSTTRRRMCVLRGWLAMFRDDIDAAQLALRGAPRHTKDMRTDPITLAGERNVRSWIRIYRNQYADARRLQRSAGHREAPHGTLFGTLSGRCLEGLSLALEGHMSKAEHVYREVLREAEPGGRAFLDPKVLAIGLLGETLYEINDLAGVLALEPRLPELIAHSLPDPLLRIMLGICRSHAVLGRIDAALRVAEGLRTYARSRRLDRLLCYALLERMRLQLARHETAQAHANWNEIAQLHARHERSDSTALGEIAIVARRAEILAHLYAGRFETARARIDALLALCEARGRQRRVAALWFQRAAVAQALGEGAAASESALQGLRLAQRLGLVRSVLDAHPAVCDLLEGALSLAREDSLLSFHADRMRAAAGQGPLAGAALGRPELDLAPAAPEGLSARELQVMQQLALALPNKEIARALGMSGETVKWHLRNIYVKLRVTTRYQALAVLRHGRTNFALSAPAADAAAHRAR
jgi:LuxR family maltose regulon positive regulatory protein